LAIFAAGCLVGAAAGPAWSQASAETTREKGAKSRKAVGRPKKAAARAGRMAGPRSRADAAAASRTPAPSHASPSPTGGAPGVPAGAGVPAALPPAPAGPAAGSAEPLAPPEPPISLARFVQAARPAPASEGPPPLQLSLKESIVIALKNNLDIAIEALTPRARDQDIVFERAAFDPKAFLELDRNEAREPTKSALSGAGVVATDNWDANGGVRQTIQTGGNYELRLNNNRFNTNSAFAQPPGGINPSFKSSLTVTFTQPLLRNFGVDVNTTKLRIAQTNRELSGQQFRLKVNDIATQVQNNYWELVFAIENLEVQRRSLRLAEELVALNKARVRAGVAAPVEVTQAEADAAARQQDVIVAEKQVKDAEDQLKLVLNLGRDEAEWAQPILPTDMPTAAGAAPDLGQAVKDALEKRPELQTARLDIQNKTLSLRLAKNQLLPDLKLVGSVGLNGVDNTYGNDLGRLTSTDFTSYSAALSLEIPLGNRAARASYTKARLEAEQSLLGQRSLERKVVVDVREATRRVEADMRRIGANKAARLLAEEQLRVEEKRLQAGVSTTFNVLRLQRDLAVAQANEIRAVADYNKSLANLERARGAVLERHDLTL
jgi:outer membrane protein TolC